MSSMFGTVLGNVTATNGGVIASEVFSGHVPLGAAALRANTKGQSLAMGVFCQAEKDAFDKGLKKFDVHVSPYSADIPKPLTGSYQVHPSQVEYVIKKARELEYSVKQQGTCITFEVTEPAPGFRLGD